MEKDLICPFMNYEITGTAKIRYWGGGEGLVQIEPSYATDITDLKKFINDGGFGCEAILNAHVNVYNCYLNNAKTFNKDEYINLDEQITKDDINQYENFELGML